MATRAELVWQRVTIRGVPLGATADQIAKLAGQPLLEADRSLQARRYRHDGGEVSVLYGQGDGRSALIWGDGLESGGKMLRAGDSEAQSHRLLSSLGPVVVRYEGWSEEPETVLWVSPREDCWLWCRCRGGKLESCALEDLSYGVGLNRPATHDPARCQLDFSALPCAECGRGRPHPGTGRLFPTPMTDRLPIGHISLGGIHPGARLSDLDLTFCAQRGPDDSWLV